MIIPSRHAISPTTYLECDQEVDLHGTCFVPVLAGNPSYFRGAHRIPAPKWLRFYLLIMIWRGSMPGRSSRESCESRVPNYTQPTAVGVRVSMDVNGKRTMLKQIETEQIVNTHKRHDVAVDKEN